MKRPYEIIKKRDKLRRAIFREDCKKAFDREPANCIYNVPVEFTDLGQEIRICGYTDPRLEGKVTICNKTCTAKECPKFEARYKTADDVADKVRLERFRGTNLRYLEADSLDWVIDEEERLAQESTSRTVKALYAVIRWIEKLAVYLKKA